MSSYDPATAEARMKLESTALRLTKRLVAVVDALSESAPLPRELAGVTQIGLRTAQEKLNDYLGRPISESSHD